MCAACSLYPTFKNYTSKNRPTDFDWRDLGAVTDVKNQKYCGSCWTFSTAADVEGTHYLGTGELVSLSEQQIVACDTNMYGCEGGYMYAAMQYVTKMGGLVSNEKYPYKGIEMDYEDNTPTCDTDLINGVRPGTLLFWQILAHTSVLHAKVARASCAYTRKSMPLDGRAR